jgi:hypothetical protein
MPEIEDPQSPDATGPQAGASPWSTLDLNNPGWRDAPYAGGASPDFSQVLGRP